MRSPCTVACQAPLTMGFPRQEHYSVLPFPPLGDLSNPGIKPKFLVSPVLAGRFFTTMPPRKPLKCFAETLRGRAASGSTPSIGPQPSARPQEARAGFLSLGEGGRLVAPASFGPHSWPLPDTLQAEGQPRFQKRSGCRTDHPQARAGEPRTPVYM